MLTDWTSRILALASLIISLGGVAYQVSNDQAIPQSSLSRDQLVNQFKEELDKQADVYQQKQKELEDHYQAALDLRDKRFGEWNASLNDALSRFNTDAKELLDQVAQQEQLASDARHTAFRRQLANFQDAATTESPSEVDSNQEIAESEASDGSASDAAATGPDLQGPSQANSGPVMTGENPEGAEHTEATKPVKGPLLQLASSALRPSSSEWMMVTLRNDTEDEAVIENIRFQPKKEFKVPGETQASEVKGSPSTISSEAVTTIRYTSNHNLSTRPGYHGLYSQKLATPIRVPAHGSVTIRIMIEDPKFVGWGLTGRLSVDYNSPDNKPLKLDGVHVAFDESSI